MCGICYQSISGREAFIFFIYTQFQRSQITFVVLGDTGKF